MGAPPVHGFVPAVYKQFPKFLPAPSTDRLFQNGDPLSLERSGYSGSRCY